MLQPSSRRHRDDERIDGKPDGPTSSHAGAMLSALFLVVFAIAIVVPWTVTDSARQNTYAEAQALTEAYWKTSGLPADDARSIRSALRDYTAFVAGREWRAMARGRLDDSGWARLDALRGELGGLDLTDKDQKAAADDVETQLEQVYAARRQRAVDARATLPSGVLMLAAITGLLVLAFPLLAGARPRGMVWLPYLLLCASMVVGVSLAFAINHAFTGPLGVNDAAFLSAQREFARIP